VTILFRMNYYTLCLFYHSNTERCSVSCLLPGWVNTNHDVSNGKSLLEGQLFSTQSELFESFKIAMICWIKPAPSKRSFLLKTCVNMLLSILKDIATNYRASGVELFKTGCTAFQCRL